MSGWRRRFEIIKGTFLGKMRFINEQKKQSFVRNQRDDIMETNRSEKEENDECPNI